MVVAWTIKEMDNVSGPGWNMSGCSPWESKLCGATQSCVGVLERALCSNSHVISKALGSYIDDSHLIMKS